MKYTVTALISAAILAAASSIAVAGPAEPAPTTNLKMTPGMNFKVLFTKGTYAGSNAKSYQCTTPYIQCPKSTEKFMLTFTNPQPVVNNANGIRFAYRCVYEETPK